MLTGRGADVVILDDPLKPDEALSESRRNAVNDWFDNSLLSRLNSQDTGIIVIAVQRLHIGHVTGGAHREFAMASDELSRAQFQAFNTAWMQAADPHLVAGGVLVTFIDLANPTVHAAAEACGLDQLNLVVWGEDQRGHRQSLPQCHELLPLYRKPGSTHVNTMGIGPPWPMAVQCLDLSGCLLDRLRCASRASAPSDRQTSVPS